MNTTQMNWRETTPDLNLLKGKKILVTGAADGIGRAVSIGVSPGWGDSHHFRS